VNSVVDALDLAGGYVPVAPDTSVPLALERIQGGERQAVIVRTYGRGYVMPCIRLKVRSEIWEGHVAVKGSGIAASVGDNLDWVRSETGRNAVTLGEIDARAMALDLSGEALCRSSDISGPRIVSAVKLTGRTRLHAFGVALSPLGTDSGSPSRGSRSVTGFCGYDLAGRTFFRCGTESS
jgi:hypothetical protein